MGYILIAPEKAREKGLEYFETLPDGRAILDFSYLKVLGSMGQVEVVGSASELNALIDAQRKSGLYAVPAEGTGESMDTAPQEPAGENVVAGEPVTEEGGESWA